MNIAEARAEYEAAKQSASAASRAILEPATTAYDKAARDARQTRTRLTAAEQAAYVTATHEAGRAWHDIADGPTARLDQALAAAKKESA